MDNMARQKKTMQDVTKSFLEDKCIKNGFNQYRLLGMELKVTEMKRIFSKLT